MREDLEQKNESFIEWIERLHKMVVDAGSMDRVDPEVLAILVNNIPTLVDSVKEIADQLNKVRESWEKINEFEKKYAIDWHRNIFSR